MAGLRFVIGITDGALYTILPMYVGEIVDPEIRGFLSSLLYTLFIVGMLLINVIGPVMNIFMSALVLSVVPVLHFFSFLFMPESPYYYVKIGNYEGAETSLRILKGSNNTTKEVNIIKAALDTDFKIMKKSKISDLWTIYSNRKACYIYLILLWTQRMSGKMPMMLFTTTIFRESGSSINATLSVIIYSIVEIIVVTSVTPFIDRFGRRPLIIVSSIGCSLMTLLLALYFYLKEIESHLIPQLNWLPITSLVSHNILYNCGIGYCTMNYLSELFPMNVKAYASCAAEIAVVLLSIVTAQFFQLTYISFGMSVPFLCFALSCALGVIFMYHSLSETKGKSLTEIQESLIRSCENEKNQREN